MNYFFEGSSLFKMGVTFVVLRMLGNIDVLKEILANNEMGLFRSFLNCFKKLFGMLAGQNGFLAFNELIIDVTFSLYVAVSVKVSSRASER